MDIDKLMTVFVGPAVIAALISALAAILTNNRNYRMSERKLTADIELGKEKLALDKALAEQKLAADVALAEQRASAEIDLAQNKINLDREAAEWKRRSEFAEKVLADFYKARHLLIEARIAWLKLDVRATTDGALIKAAYDYLSKDKTFFSRLKSKQPQFMVLFGDEAGRPFDVIAELYEEIERATSRLSEPGATLTTEEVNNFFMKVGLLVHGNEADTVADEINSAVGHIYRICQKAQSGLLSDARIALKN